MHQPAMPRRLAIGAFLFVFFLPFLCPADAIFWNGSVSGDWHTAANWTGGVVPIDGDTATLGAPLNDQVSLSDNVFGIDGLTVQSGIDFATNGFFLNVDEGGAANTVLQNTGTTLEITPRVSNPSQPAFKTEGLSIESGAGVTMQGGLAQADVSTLISRNSFLSGYGTFEFGNEFTSLRSVLENNGTITVARTFFGDTPLVLRALGAGELDLDGTESGPPLIPEGGRIDADDGNLLGSGALTLVVDGPLADEFSGTIDIGQADTVEFTNPWRLDTNRPNLTAVLSLNGHNGTATIRGETMTVASRGQVVVSSGTGAIDAPSSWSGELLVSSDSTAIVRQDATFAAGATVDLAEGSSLLFGSDSGNVITTINGGTWNSAGRIDFGGISPFTSSTFISGDTTMDVDVVDLDGGAASTHFLTLDRSLTLNVDSIDGDDDGIGNPDNQFDDFLTINPMGKLTVNFSDPNQIWVMNGALTLHASGDPLGTVLLTGANIELANLVAVNGVANIDGVVKITGRIGIASGGRLNAFGPNLQQVRIEGGIVDGPGSLSVIAIGGLTGYGTLNADFVAFDDLTADDGLLTVNGLLDAGTVGTADNDGILDVTNPWNSNNVARVELNGGELRGATITNDNSLGIAGFGAVTARVVNNTHIDATGDGTLILQTALDDNDWDGSTDAGQLNATLGNLELRSSGGFSFHGSVNIGDSHELYINGFEMSYESGSTVSLGDQAVHRQTPKTDFGSVLNVAAGSATLVDGAVDFESTSTTTLDGDLLLENVDAFIDSGAAFSGAGDLLTLNDSQLTLADGADVGVLIENHGLLTIAGSGAGRADVEDFEQTESGTLHVDILEIGLSDFDRLVAGGGAQLDGELDVSLLVGFIPDVGDSFTIVAATFGVTGEFATVRQPTELLAVGRMFDVVYDPTLARLLVIEASGVPGDYNEDGVVNAADYVVWRNLNGTSGDLPNRDPNASGDIDQDDYQFWVDHFGSSGSGSSSTAAVPEPATVLLLAVSALVANFRTRRMF